MRDKKASFTLAAAAIALFLDGAIALRGLQVASAAVPARRATISQKVSIRFLPKRAPKRTVGAGSRGYCRNDPQETPFLTALLPYAEESDKFNKPVLTVAERPTFYFYIPTTSAREAGFRIADESEKDIYVARFALTGKPGIISITLPASAPSLEIGKKYRWYFSMICAPENSPPAPLVLNDWIERTALSPTLAKALENVAPLQQAKLYAENDIWTETLALLAQLRRSQPDDALLTAEWEELLNSISLEELAEKPFLDVK